MRQNKRKVCVIVASRANYARIKYFMKAVTKSSVLELQIIVCASALSYKFGKVIDIIKKDGFAPDRKIYYLLEGENLITQATSTGIGITELAPAFDDLKPDVVVTVADRYETMATAIAASYLNIPLAHIQGGEVSGNIDDSVRNAVTKLAHLHYPSTQKSADRIIKMGEEPWRVYFSGCPSIDILKNNNLKTPSADYFIDKGTGINFDPDKPYVLILQHPVTNSFGKGADQIKKILTAAKDLPYTKLLLWPNADAGSGHVSKAIREFQYHNPSITFSYHINFPPEIFASLLLHAQCLIGNSSSFIREGAFLGTPTVIVGDRQIGREHGQNIMFAEYDSVDIYEKVTNQIEHGPYESESIFGDGNASEKIAKHMETARLDINKRNTY